MSERLANSMLKGLGLDHSCHDPELIETHISWLVLVGDFAYKIKKPVNLGFLDFSTLALRKHFCEEELRLNLRTAPDIYLDVLPVSGTEAQPAVGDATRPFEFVVKMRRFDNAALLNRIADCGRLDEPIVHALAHAIATLHERADRSLPQASFATPEAIRMPVDQNFHVLDNLLTGPVERALLAQLREWSEREFTQRASHFESRRNHGYARECHGDLHLANILYRDGKCTLFDCIEFNEQLRWIDVASDIAFTIMDLESYGLPAAARLLLNEYLQHTGDYDALGVLEYYLTYRAMVRAKVCAIRAGQDTDHAGQLRHDVGHYLDLGGVYAREGRPFLALMSGLSGTGKTWVARKLSAGMAAIHIRSDVERKRLYDLSMAESSHARGLDIYSDEGNRRTFDALERLARETIKHGFPVVVDATFIEHSLRRRFEGVAEQLGVPWAIVSCSAPEEIVRQRLAARAGDASEAGIDQYQDQKARAEPFDAEEVDRLVVLDTSAADGTDALVARVRARLGQLAED